MKLPTVEHVDALYSAISQSTNDNINHQKLQELESIRNNPKVSPEVKGKACFHLASIIYNYAKQDNNSYLLFGKKFGTLTKNAALKQYLIQGSKEFGDPNCTVELANLVLEEKPDAKQTSEQFQALQYLASNGNKDAVNCLIRQCTYIESIASLWRLSCDTYVEPKTTSLIKSLIAAKLVELETRLKTDNSEPRTLAWMKFLDNLIKTKPSTDSSTEKKSPSVPFNTLVYDFILSFKSNGLGNFEVGSFWNALRTGGKDAKDYAKNYEKLEQNTGFQQARTELFAQLAKPPQALVPLTSAPTKKQQERIACETYTALVGNDAKPYLELGKLWQPCAPRLAFAYYKRGADYNNQDCQAEVAIAYYQGLEVTENQTKGLQELMSLAKQGNDVAQAYLVNKASGVNAHGLDFTICHQLVNWISSPKNEENNEEDAACKKFQLLILQSLTQSTSSHKWQTFWQKHKINEQAVTEVDSKNYIPAIIKTALEAKNNSNDNNDIAAQLENIASNEKVATTHRLYAQQLLADKFSQLDDEKTLTQMPKNNNPKPYSHADVLTQILQQHSGCDLADLELFYDYFTKGVSFQNYSNLLCNFNAQHAGIFYEKIANYLHNIPIDGLIWEKSTDLSKLLKGIMVFFDNHSEYQYALKLRCLVIKVFSSKYMQTPCLSLQDLITETKKELRTAATTGKLPGTQQNTQININEESIRAAAEQALEISDAADEMKELKTAYTGAASTVYSFYKTLCDAETSSKFPEVRNQASRYLLALDKQRSDSRGDAINARHLSLAKQGNPQDMSDYAEWLLSKSIFHSNSLERSPLEWNFIAYKNSKKEDQAKSSDILKNACVAYQGTHLSLNNHDRQILGELFIHQLQEQTSPSTEEKHTVLTPSVNLFRKIDAMCQDKLLKLDLAKLNDFIDKRFAASTQKNTLLETITLPRSGSRSIARSTTPIPDIFTNPESSVTQIKSIELTTYQKEQNNDIPKYT